jgi:glycosyltransferase involved in cell wall biosynthesis
MTARSGSGKPLVFGIVSNGFVDGPAQALRDYLVGGGHRVVTVFHPLENDPKTAHVVSRYRAGALGGTRTYRIPLRPPLSYALDPLVPLPRADVWFGFNPLACARGLVERRLGRARTVVLWSVDFVPDRFGNGSLLTRLYDRLDRLCCSRADARVELSEAARDGRERRHGLPPDPDRTHVVPMGAWLDRTPTVPLEGLARRRVVFLGHLVPRQGVDALLDALAVLRARGDPINADVLGQGPEEVALRERACTLGLSDVVHFHGFVEDHRDVEHVLAASSIAVAPYRPDADTFTRFADPGKLKAYLAAGLPIVLTDVPPNAAELAREAGAEIVPYNAVSIADALASGLGSPERWQQRRHAALEYARRFDWAVLLRDLLRKLELDA